MGDRQVSVLTNSQREFLKEGKEGAAGRMARKRIRERAHEALFDFPLLVSGLDEKDREWIFEDHDLAGKDHTLNVLSSVFAFLYLGITDTVEPEDLAKDAVEDIAASGVREALLQRGVSVDEVEVDIDVTLGEPLDELEERDELSYPEVNQLLESGRLSDLSGEEKIELLNKSLESGKTEKVGAYPNFTVPAESEDTEE